MNTDTDSTEPVVLVVDDDASIRRGVSRLARSAGFTVKTFASPDDFLQFELPTGPACVVLDFCMDGMNGLEVQDALRAGDRKIPIVFVSGHGTIATATTSIKRGADDFLEKPFRPQALVEAIRRAIERDRAASGDRLAHQHDRGLFDTLTQREKEVMVLVVRGLLNKQAAAELGISEKTIKVHRARVMEKMKVQSLADLVRLAERLEVDFADSVEADAGDHALVQH